MTLAVTNRLSEPSSIHWHVIILPNPMDGVPGLTFAGIPPGETFVYRFPVRQNGTYWYHSHSGFQEQTGLYGPLVIAPKGGYGQAFDRDYVVMLSDWTDEGQYAAAGQPALTFLDARLVWLQAFLRENSLEYIAPGTRAEVVLDVLPGRSAQTATLISARALPTRAPG